MECNYDVDDRRAGRGTAMTDDRMMGGRCDGMAERQLCKEGEEDKCDGG